MPDEHRRRRRRRQCLWYTVVLQWTTVCFGMARAYGQETESSISLALRNPWWKEPSPSKPWTRGLMSPTRSFQINVENRRNVNDDCNDDDCSDENSEGDDDDDGDDGDDNSSDSDDGDEKEQNGSSDDNDDDPFKKGLNQADPSDCATFFRENEGSADGDLPCRLPVDSTVPDSPLNELVVSVTVGLRPEERSIAHILTFLLSHNWNHTQPNTEVIVGTAFRLNDEEMDEIVDAISENINEFEDFQSVSEKAAAERSSARNAGGNNRRSLVERLLEFLGQGRRLPASERIILVHEGTDATLLEKGRFRWWWRYDLVYSSFWKDDFSPVDPAALEQIAALIFESLQANEDKLQRALQIILEDTFVRLRTNVAEGVSVDPLTSSPTSAPTSSSTGGKIFRDNDDVTPPPEDGNAPAPIGPTTVIGNEEPINVHRWGFQRYFGLALLVLTSVGMFLLSQIASIRQRNRLKKHVWGNLAYEEGVDELLRTGWILKGSNMIIYDRANEGHNDDDSLFIGGFEQREALVGTVATAVLTQSVTTPEQ